MHPPCPNAPTDGRRALPDPMAPRPAPTPVVLVQVLRTQGSTPREPGAWMLVPPDGPPLGSIGGGHLEWDALARARRLLAADPGANAVPLTWRVALGASLGQCCGGVVWLQAQRVPAAEAQALTPSLAPPPRPLALFGAGHVGQALVRVLAPLPFALHWFDARDERDFAEGCGLQGPAPAFSDPPQAAVPGLPAGARVLVMTHSHAQDLDIVAACLARQRERGDLGRIGLIGSRSKWAAFRRQLLARGFEPAAVDAVQCPIGLAGVRGKAPQAIAIAVAAQLLSED